MAEYFEFSAVIESGQYGLWRNKPPRLPSNEVLARKKELRPAYREGSLPSPLAPSGDGVTGRVELGEARIQNIVGSG